MSEMARLMIGFAVGYVIAICVSIAVMWKLTR